MPAITSATPIRASMDKALTDTFAKLPPSSGRGFARVTAGLSGGQIGLKVEAAHRINQTWAVGGWAGLAKGQSLEAGVALHGGW